METYSTLIWKIVGALAVLWIAQKLISLFNNPTAIANQPTTSPVAKPNIIPTSSKTGTSASQSINPADKVITTPNNTKLATPEKKEVFSKDAKDRELNLEQRKKALTEKARGNMLNSMFGSSTATTSQVRTSPVVNTPNVSSSTISSPTIGELYNPVPLEQQVINSNLSKSTPSSSATRPVEEKKPAKSLTQSQSPNRVRKEKPPEEGLCLQTGEIKPITKTTTAEEDRETKRRRAIEALGLDKNKEV